VTDDTAAILLLSMISTAGTVIGIGIVEEVREGLLLLSLSLLYVFLIIDLGEDGDDDGDDGNEEEDNDDNLAGGAVDDAAAIDSHAV
jgi:hypothetical protein